MTEPRYLAVPFQMDGSGRTATTALEQHVRDLIYQVLFTSPGERVNRPDFGCGLKSLLFMPNDDTLATATQVLVKGALQQWLETEIQVERVDVRAVDAQLVIAVAYSLRATGERRVDQFESPGEA